MTTTQGTNTGTHAAPQQGRGLGLPRAGGPGGPVRPRTRSWGLVTGAALLVLLTGLAGALLVSQASETTTVLAAGKPIAKGQQVTEGDLVQKSVSGIDGVPVEDMSTLVGKTAVVDILDGQVMTPQMVAEDPLPGEGRAVVGLALEPNRVPAAGLQAGDLVRLIAVPAAADGGSGDDEDLGAPKVLADEAEVLDVKGDGTAGGQVLLTVIVEDGDAEALAAYSTQNRVAAIETAPTGEGE